MQHRGAWQTTLQREVEEPDRERELDYYTLSRFVCLIFEIRIFHLITTFPFTILTSIIFGNVQKSFIVESVSNCFSPDWWLWWNRSVSVARRSEVKKKKYVKFVKWVVFMEWQGTFKLSFIIFFWDAYSEILPHNWNITTIPETTSSSHLCAIADYSHLSAEIVGIYTKFIFKIISKEYNWVRTAVMKAVDLESLSVDFISYLWSENRSLGKLWRPYNIRKVITRNLSKNENIMQCLHFLFLRLQSINKNRRTGITYQKQP